MAPKRLSLGLRIALTLIGVAIGVSSAGCRSSFDASDDVSTGTASSDETGSDETSGPMPDFGGDGDGDGDGDGNGDGDGDGTTDTGDDTDTGGECLSQGAQCSFATPDPPCCEGLTCSFTGSFTTCQP